MKRGYAAQVAKGKEEYGLSTLMIQFYWLNWFHWFGWLTNKTN